jgi:hypothetical protein
MVRSGKTTGLSPNIDLYLFIVAKDAAGKPSRPGEKIQSEPEGHVSAAVRAALACVAR